MREKLPPLIAAAFSIIPHLLAVQIMIQNTLLAQYYTVLHNYCEENGFQSPPPSMDAVMTVWGQDFKPIQQQVERITCIARGKAVHQSMTLGSAPAPGKSITGLNVRNGFSRRPSAQPIGSAPVSPNPEPRDAPDARDARMRIPSSASIPSVAHSAPEPSPSPEPVLATPTYTTPDYSTHLTPVSSYSSHSPAGPTMDYFQRSSNLGAAAAKKKKAPPPPPKRIGSQNSGMYATALYSFEGQNQDDLSFQEGDQIKVIKKTDSTDDWWEGELRGRKGSFPANYCKIV